MSEKFDQNFLMRLKKSLRPLKIYNNLKSVYLTLIPKGSKAYQISHGFLSVILKRFHLFNISYQEWIKKIDHYSEQDLAEIRHKIDMMEDQPHISIVMPVYNPPLSLLEEAILSVIQQIYPYWELCIADDASTDPEVRRLIEDFMQKDERIKAIFRPENGHISVASNSAISLVDYPYIALLDHDDVLHPHALYYVAQTLLAYPDSEIIYSDEDKITKRGRRIDAYFKPDFNYELLLSHNMVSHLGVYRTETIRKIGGFRKGLEGSQDYDLLLRVFENVHPNQIHHIPFPLYHWRITKASAADDVNVKPYAIESGVRALQEHLDRVSIDGKVNFAPDLAAYTINHHLPSPPPAVDVLIHDLEFSDALVACTNTLLENTGYPNFVIQLGLPISTKPIAKIDQFGWGNKVQLLFIPDEKMENYSERLNYLMENTSDAHVVFMDQSLVRFPSDWLSTLMGQALQANIGAVGPKLLYQNDVVYSSGVVLLPTGEARHMFKGEEQAVNGYFGWARLTRGYSTLSDKCLLIKRELFDLAGGFAEVYKTSFYAAVDFCLRLKARGLRNIAVSSIELYMNENHHYNLRQEFPPDLLEADQRILKDRWEDWILHDPAFNPNLTIIDEGKLTANLSPRYSFIGKRCDENL
jgi:glycosyltransferase involved in cell wall biosynthesis